ncbi:MAG: alpha/beta hydrolase [Acidobacteria bacterium]|nr:MAG: alpha/beta hydrolase [Acidobacteriota bacterium]
MRLTPWRVLALVAVCLVIGAVSGILVLYIQMARGRADLEPWHRMKPEAEFTARRAEEIKDLEAYAVLEDRLFEDIAETLSREVQEWPVLSRLDPASPTNPGSFPRNWNRTFRLEPDRVVAGALLLHGLSDSPYSLHAVAQHLQKRGVMCVGLRLPGHGGVPGGLTSVRMEDWRAAVRLAARDLRGRLDPSLPLILVGYSNGAALALDYTLDALNDEDLGVPQRLVFFSPAFAVSRIAAFARWQRLVSILPGLEKLAWTDILPEYDPFKFNSFPLRAAEEIYRLTTDLERKLKRLERDGRLADLPPVLGFQSVVDATVPAKASLPRLYRRLKVNGSRLVLFDVDREARSAAFLTPEANRVLSAAEKGGPWSFDIAIVTNHSPENDQVELRTIRAGLPATEFEVDDLGMVWPKGVYSLSHVALPFPPEDPVYGVGPVWRDPFPLGRIDPRGEKGALVVPLSLLMRLRYNPFFEIMPPMIDQFLGLDDSNGDVLTAES